MKLDVHGRAAYATPAASLGAATALRRLHPRRAQRPLGLDAARALVRAPRHRVLAVDQPGHGRSDGPPLASVEALADWVLALLDAAGVTSAHLVGHSMGSLIALEAASRAPERAAGLVMVGTAYPMKVSDALLDTARDDPARAIAMVNAFSHSGIASKPSYPGPGAWLRGGASALMHRIQDGADGQPVRARLPRLRRLRQRRWRPRRRVRCPAP
jgi:pimeloyl-ACP methyl ester carboxylesterase